MKDKAHEIKTSCLSTITASPYCPNPSSVHRSSTQCGVDWSGLWKHRYHFREGVHTGIADPLWGGRAVQPEWFRHTRVFPCWVDSIFNGIKHWSRQEQRRLSHSLDRTQAKWDCSSDQSWSWKHQWGWEKDEQVLDDNHCSHSCFVTSQSPRCDQQGKAATKQHFPFQVWTSIYQEIGNSKLELLPVYQVWTTPIPS